ncbi:DUF2515 domain-containing protein [Paenibacillus xerothermodurans]|uniref:DUF2515 domain-containing protein n=1 Tax=Paenibacillus xerothermodurans TaxID=1977292 RepID=A0A2W1NC47_PAEXE|nr:DUF2515 domain-containing protein [Paenibacillus xerothermodurans]
MKGKISTLSFEQSHLDTISQMQINWKHVEELRLSLSKTPPSSTNPTVVAEAPMSDDEKAMIASIRERTEQLNRNNISRTQAYWQMYRRHPELHWAFLAHMVSRNGGWNITDLKGELLPYLLRTDTRLSVFGMLERSNALIFHDAYAQLLLYDISRRRGRSFFHLLPRLGVSGFMRPVWEIFFARGDSGLLTTALIINEQNYIQKRVIEHAAYRELVLDTLFFSVQSLLQLNQVILPYEHEGRVRLAGLIIENFRDLHERIQVGRKLYAILFGIPAVFHGATHFAAGLRHTGSRADYWPHLFASIRRSPPVPRGELKEWLDGCSLMPEAAPLYSPRLTDAWKDQLMAPAEPGDWFVHDGGRCLQYFSPVEPPFAFEMTHEYCFGLKKIELAVLTGDLVQ